MSVEEVCINSPSSVTAVTAYLLLPGSDVVVLDEVKLTFTGD